MGVLTLVEDISSSSHSGDVKFVHVPHRELYCPVQVKITSSATVNVQGRVDSSMPWVTLNSFTSSGVENIRLLPEMRVSVSGNDGDVTVKAAI